ncbi:HlyD family type I secretion periplasmic adaptor subunit [Noviherbaspirillum sedimenti]|nr:HlyD family type I secretion periplasmic adaptor subunit [Noviherbaspirillum sedimenti]
MLRAKPMPVPQSASGWEAGSALMSEPVNDAEYLQGAQAHLLHGPRRVTRWAFWLALLFWTIALAWAALAEVDEFAVAEGKVIPSSRVQVVQNLEGGIIAEILVRSGDAVKKDQPLLRIDKVRFASATEEGRAKERTLLARIARLAAEADGTPFAPPAALANTHLALVAEESSLYASRQQALRANLAVLQQQAEQRLQELAEKRARQQRLQESYALVSSELSMVRPMASQGYIAQINKVRLEREANDLQGELEAARLALPRLESALREARRKSDEQGSRFRAEAMKDLSLARAELAALSAINTELEDRLRRTEVRAPLAGVVKQLKVHTVGGVIQPGMDLMEIVPHGDTLLIEARARPADIAFLRPGQEAMVKLSAYDFSIYGGFPGKLEQVGADTLTPDKPGERAESYYLVQVRTRGSTPTGSREALSIMPGMVATVDIRTGRRTVLHYLLKPIVKIRDGMLRER